jgi:hypothetical protein
LRGETQPLSEALQFGKIVGGNAAVAASAKQDHLARLLVLDVGYSGRDPLYAHVGDY